MGLFELAAAKMLSSAAMLLFGTVLLMATAKRISTCVYLFACQSAILTAEVVAAGYVPHMRGAYIIAGRGLLLKDFASPFPLLWVMKQLRTAHQPAASLTP